MPSNSTVPGMPKNPSLIPTVITDVNGKTTTVYKKHATSSKAPKIPAPSPASDKERLATIDAIAEFYDMRQDGGTKDEKSRQAAKSVLKNYPMELLTKIHRCYLANSYSHRNITLMIFCNHSPTIMDEFITLLPRTIASVMRAEPALRSLHLYKQFPECENFAQQDERVLEQGAAIIDVASAMARYLEDADSEPLQWIKPPIEWDGFSASLPIIKDERVIDLLMERPEAGQRIARFIKERRHFDYDLILDVVTHETPAIVEGIL